MHSACSGWRKQSMPGIPPAALAAACSNPTFFLQVVFIVTLSSSFQLALRVFKARCFGRRPARLPACLPALLAPLLMYHCLLCCHGLLPQCPARCGPDGCGFVEG